MLSDRPCVTMATGRNTAKRGGQQISGQPEKTTAETLDDANRRADLRQADGQLMTRPLAPPSAALRSDFSTETGPVGSSWGL